MDLPRTLDPQVPARKRYIVWREKRLFELEDWIVASLVGVSYDGGTEGLMLSSYLNLENLSPLLAGFEDATRIITGTHRV